MKKIRKAIAKKFKNWKTTTSKETEIQEPSISSSRDKRRRQKILEDISSVKTTIEQQTTPIAKTTTAKDENSKEVCKYSVTNKDTTHAIDKATETDTKLCESEDLQPICESNEEAQIETTVEPTSVDRGEANKQEPNAPDSPSSAEPCFDATEEKDKPLTQQRQAILASVVGAILLASGVALYIMKMPVVALVVGIAGLVCIGFALYNIINPNTKLEKVKSVEQPIIQSSLNPA